MQDSQPISNLWDVVMALAVIVAPLLLAWLLLSRNERRRDARSGTAAKRSR